MRARHSFLAFIAAIVASGSVQTNAHGQGVDPYQGPSDAVRSPKELTYACSNCPAFVAVPVPPKGLRSITHVAKFELTWLQYIEAVERGNCSFPLQHPDGTPFTPAERDKFKLNWSANYLRMSDVACYKNWLQKAMPPGYELAIPTGAEWLWLAKAGDAVISRSPISAIFQDSAENVRDKAPPSAGDLPASAQLYPVSCGPVGQMPPNNWGVFDMLGGQQEITSAPIKFGPKGLARIVELRGGDCRIRSYKAYIETPIFGVLREDGDSVVTAYAVRMVLIKSN